MNNTLKRAAIAARQECSASYVRESDPLTETTVDGDVDFIAMLRAGLVAALDPEEETLVNLLGPAYVVEMRGAIEALRAHVTEATSP